MSWIPLSGPFKIVGPTLCDVCTTIIIHVWIKCEYFYLVIPTITIWGDLMRFVNLQ